MDSDEMLQHSEEVARGTFWGLTGNFIGKILAFLYTIYVARVVSQGDVGLFYLALGIVGLFGVWKDFGLPSALTRYVPYYESRNEHKKSLGLLKLTLLADTISGIVLTAVIWLVAGIIGDIYHNPLLPEALRLMSFYMLLDNVLRVTGGYIQGRAQIKLGQLIGNVQLLAKLALTFILFQLWGPNYTSVTVSFLASLLIGILISLPFVYQKPQEIHDKKDELLQTEIIREIVPFGIMLTVIQTFYTIISSADRAIIGYLAPQATAANLVATYSLATTLAVNLIVFPATVGAIFLPLISRMVGKNDIDGIRKAVGSGQRWVLFITLPFFAVMIVFSSEMLTSFYGTAYGNGGATMAIFLAGLVFSTLAYTINLALAGMRLVKLELQVAIIAGIINVALNFALVPSLGIEGAALAGAVSFAVSSLLIIHYGKKMIGFETPSEAYRLIAAGAATCLAIFVMKPALGAVFGMVPQIGGADISPYVSKLAYLGLLGMMCAVAFAVFGALSIYLKCFEREDAIIFKKMAKRAFLPGWVVAAAEKMLLYGIAPKHKETGK